MQLRMMAVSAALALGGCELNAASMDDNRRETVTLEAVADAATLDAGRKVYEQQRCQTCHAIDGVGNRRNPLDGVGAKLSADDIRKWIVAPKSMDPKVRKRAYDKLAADELAALVAYLCSLK